MTSAILTAMLWGVAGVGEVFPGWWETPPDPLPPLPTYDCVYTPTPPVIDGNLDDPAWRRAQPVRLVRAISATTPEQATTVRLLWDEEYLYLGWRVQEWNIQDHNVQRDDPVFTEQCVEVFLQPAHLVPATPEEDHRYLEANASPTGVIFDALVSNPMRAGESMVGDGAMDLERLRVATRVWGTVNDDSDRDHGWTCEYAIPFTELPGWSAPGPGDVWRLNLYRIHNWERPEVELQAWSAPGAPDFHLPTRFGYLRFVGPQ